MKSLKVDDYVSDIEDLIANKQFVEDYKNWAFKLFSDPDYLYGKKPGDFPCTIPSEKVRNDPITVHNLRPSDVQCVGAIGDSLTAGLGANALTPIGLYTEYRGVSWSIGGDYTFDSVLTLPNILRLYNPKLKGFSTKTDITFLGGQNATNNGLNVAKSGDRSYHMIDQVHLLYQRIVKDGLCDLQNDWKIITFFIGANDLCIFCEDLNKHSPDNFVSYISETLDFLYENFPRTFVNLVLVLDVRFVKQLNDGGAVCSLLHSRSCPCAAFPTDNDTQTLAQWIPLYHSKVIDLINTGKYDQRDDFTVAIQPFMANTTLPLVDGQIDYSYFAPDCFHFSGKGQSKAALSLWNNMLEPVGQKQWRWYEGEQLECPTQERPFFATRKNSPQSFEKMPQAFFNQ